MGLERRGCIVQPRPRANGSQLATGGARGRGKAAGRVCQRLNIGSRVNREVHARIWERPGVRFLRATRQKRTNRHGQIRHLCPLLPESDQITDLAVLPCTLTHSESWSRFRVWWLAWAAVERQDRQRASPSHGGVN